MDCIFCEIINGNIPTTKIYEDDYVIAFNDLNPQAPFHILIVPKIHISSCDDITAENCDFLSKIFLAAKKIAKENNLSGGYRIVNNCGDDAGQTVKHIHFHVLAKRQLAWPPG